MSPSALPDAYDLVAWSDVLHARLNAAFKDIARKQGLKDEKEWLGAAIELLESAREGAAEVLARATALPELEATREDRGRALQQAGVDAVERLQAGITFHGGARSPLLEAVFAKLKVPAARKAVKKDFEKFCADFEKRLATGYVKRMFADAAYEPVRPAAAQVRAAFEAWRAAFSPKPLSDADAKGLRQELSATAHRLEVPMRQARLLAEAALAPVKGAFEASGLGQRPKRRAAKAAQSAEAPAMEAPAAGAPAEEEPPSGKAAPKPKRKAG